MMRRYLYTLACLILSTLASMAKTSEDRNFQTAKNLDLFHSIYKNLDLLYVDTLDANKTIDYGINAMLSSLDPYTVYYPEDKVKDLKFMITGKYAGIGSLIKYNNQISRVVIDEPYAGMPAAEAGLKKGDIILSIDGEDVTKRDQAYVSEHLRGDAGTTFTLKVLRPTTSERLTFKITRRAIQTPSVPYFSMLNDSIGYITLSSFTEGASKEVRHAFAQLKEQGMKRLIFDLRGNGGGSEAEAVDIVNIFVPKGEPVVSNRGKITQANNDYRTTREAVDTIMPLVVLVNGGSASASEIVSGALQDLDRATILGTKTYGKGLVQMTVDLPYNSVLKLTTAKYYIPSGRCIQAIDYKHGRNAGATEVKDTLRRTFYTKKGRPVLDAGGITPDIEVETDSLPNIVYYLISQKDSNEVLLNYVVDYIAKHPKITSPDKFELTDTDYADFKARMIKANFTYDRLTEKYLKELIKIAKIEGYYYKAKNDFETLEQKLTHNLSYELDYHRKPISNLISSEIIPAYYYQRGLIQYNLRGDKQVKAAMNFLEK